MSNNTNLSPRRLPGWRLVLALAGKDIIDALRNKTTVTIMLGLGLMMLSVEALPLLLQLDERPRVVLFDADRTAVADEMRRANAVQVAELRAAADVQPAAREASRPQVALALPAGWSAGSGALAVDGYVVPWLPAPQAAAVRAQAEQAFTAVTARPLVIRLHTVYPTLANGGRTIMVSLGLILATTMITSILVPYLILEEKTAHTLELLRVSPVSVRQLLLGKGLAGVVYGVVAAAVLLSFNLRMVNLWGLLLAALLGTIFFGVGLGLLVGALVENEGGVQMWIGIISMLLMMPLMLVFVDSSRMPDWLAALLGWLPTAAAFDLLRLSFGNEWPPLIWSRLAAVGAAVLLVYLLAGWRLRRWEP